MNKNLITILVVLAVSIPAEADLLDKASGAYDKLLGRVSLVCDTPRQANKKLHGFHPNSKYNIVIRIRKPGKLIAIERHVNNYNYDESEGFSFSDISDKKIQLEYRNVKNKVTSISIDRYNGSLLGYQNNPFIVYFDGECEQGTLDSKKKF